MLVPLLCLILAGAASAQDGLSPITAVARVEGSDPGQALVAAPAPTIFTAATATQLGGPDSFEVTLTYPAKTTDDGLKAGLQTAQEAIVAALGAKVVDSTVQPPPAASPQGWQPAAGADRWAALRFTIAPVTLSDLATVADKLTAAATNAGATNWTAIARRAAPVEASEDLLKAAIAEARRMADLTAKAAGLTLNGISSIASRPLTPRPCYFQMGAHQLPSHVPAPDSSIGTRAGVEVWTAWR
jgi:hypothetical protein